MTSQAGSSPYLLVSPAIALLIVMGVAPLALILFISLQSSSTTALWQQVWTIGNYRKIVGDSFYAVVLANSFRVGAITTLLCAVISYPVGYHLARVRGTLRSVAMFFVLCPLLVSTVINTLGWIVILGDNGVVNAVMRALGLARRFMDVSPRHGGETKVSTTTGSYPKRPSQSLRTRRRAKPSAWLARWATRTPSKSTKRLLATMR